MNPYGNLCISCLQNVYDRKVKTVVSLHACRNAGAMLCEPCSKLGISIDSVGTVIIPNGNGHSNYSYRSNNSDNRL